MHQTDAQRHGGRERPQGDPRIGVLMLTKGLGRGGTERLLVGAARNLDRARFRVEVAYLLPWKDALVDEIRATGTPVHCLDAPRPTSVAWLVRLRRLVAEQRIDIVHTHMPLPAVAARLVLPGGRGPALVHTEHNMWSRYRAPTRWANARTYTRNAAAIAVSDGVAASIRSRVPTHVVVHGADVAQVATGPAARMAARHALGLPADAQVLGTVGNFTAKKDQATLIEAFASLVRHLGEARGATDRRADTRLVLVGSGPLEGQLRAHVRDRGLDDAVIFAGSRDDVSDLLPAFDVFALSSRFEGLPIALLEAMATGVPPVATRVGGIPEVITEGGDGLLVAPGDPMALAAAVSELLDDPVRRSAMGEAARRRAGQFDLLAAVRRTEAIYEQVLGATTVGSAPVATSATAAETEPIPPATSTPVAGPGTGRPS